MAVRVAATIGSDTVKSYPLPFFITFVIFSKANPTPAQYMCGGRNEETQETDNPEREYREIPT